MLAAALSGAGATARGEDAADLILTHGFFYPVAYPVVAPGKVAGGLAVRGGRIVYLGDDAGAAAFRGPATEVIDLAGRAVTPGLIDAHSHLTSLGAALTQVDLVGAASYEQVVRRVAAAAAKLPPGAWVFGRGWDQNRWPDQRFPSHGPLSAAVPGRPVWVDRVDGHAALLNARAMELLGIAADTPDPAGGRFVRDADGRPSGVLIDNAMDAYWARLPGPSAAELAERIRLAAAHCLAVGLTTVTEMGIGEAPLAAYRSLRDAGELPIRVMAFVADQPALLDRWFAAGPAIDPEARFTVRGVKLYADGALGSRGAALIEPYQDDSGNLGLLVSSEDHLREVAARAVAAGFQVAIHAIGNRGNLVALDALEAALGGPRPELRERIEHAQVMRLQNVARLAQLKIIASIQPTHATSDMP